MASWHAPLETVCRLCGRSLPPEVLRIDTWISKIVQWSNITIPRACPHSAYRAATQASFDGPPDHRLQCNRHQTWSDDKRRLITWWDHTI